MSAIFIKLLPLICVILALTAFLGGYAIAVGNNHVDPWIPFISDCGALFPERQVFGQILTLATFFLAVTIYLIHRKIVTFYEDQNVELRSWKTFSKFTLFIGLIATLGGTIVANFAESEQLTVHSIGAFAFFVGIIIYYWCLVIISYTVSPKFVSIHLTNFRMLLTFSLSLIVIFHIICLFVQPFVTRVNGKLPPSPVWKHNIARPNSTSPFYTNHVAAALSEWIMALLILIGFLTFTYEFSTSTYESPRLTSDSSTDSLRRITPVVKETCLSHYDVSTPYSDYNPEYFSKADTTSRRLPRIDKIYTAGTVHSTRMSLASPQYSAYNHY